MTEAEKLYYERRAVEYDDWYLGSGLFAERIRPGWHAEMESLQALLRSLSIGPVLDVACGTGFLTQHLPGDVVGLDHSLAMLKIARKRLAGGVLRGDALRLPFHARAFGCVVAGHFYGHLDGQVRARFLAEARRVGRHILIIDAALRDDVASSGEQTRVLEDGSRHMVYKRYFTPAQLVSELGQGRVLHAGRWFVVVLA